MPLALCFLLVPAAAQTPRAQAEKELARRVPAGSVQACSLIARADVKKATGIDPYMSTRNLPVKAAGSAASARPSSRSTPGEHTLALSVDAPNGKSAESMRPALESLMKLVLSRLR